MAQSILSPDPANLRLYSMSEDVIMDFSDHHFASTHYISRCILKLYTKNVMHIDIEEAPDGGRLCNIDDWFHNGSFIQGHERLPNQEIGRDSFYIWN